MPIVPIGFVSNLIRTSKCYHFLLPWEAEAICVVTAAFGFGFEFEFEFECEFAFAFAFGFGFVLGQTFRFT